MWSYQDGVYRCVVLVLSGGVTPYEVEQRFSEKLAKSLISLVDADEPGTS